MRLILQIVWGLVFLLLFACVVLSYFFAGDFLFIDYLSLIPQWLYCLGSGVCVLGGLIIFRSRARLLCFLPIILFVFVLISLVDSVWFSRVKVAQSGSEKLRIVTWNTLAWNLIEEPRLFDIMREKNADVYFFQEVPQRGARGVSGRIAQSFDNYQATHSADLLTVSRFPILSSYYVSDNGFSRTVVDINGQEVALYNVHFARPYYLNEFRRYSDFEWRKHQFDALNTMLLSEKRRVIIAGDFNSTRNYPFVKDLEERYLLGNPYTLFTMPRTYPSRFPLIRIDFIFSSKDSHFSHYEEFSYPEISDHRGIVSELSFDL